MGQLMDCFIPYCKSFKKMKIIHILSILICLVVSSHAANNLRVGTRSLDETLKSKWKELENQFNEYFEIYYKKKMALLLSMKNAEEIPGKITDEKNISSQIIRFANLENPWSEESFENIVKSAKILDAEKNPLQLVADFTPEIMNSWPLQIALKKEIDLGIPAQEAITDKFKNKSAGVNVSVLSDDNRTKAFLYAVEEGYEKLVQELINSNTDVNKCYGGRPPLYVASSLGHVGVVTQLIAAEGIDLNQVNHFGSTALNVASEYGNVGVVELLIKAGANVNTANRYGETSLHLASSMGHTEVVRLLLDKGAAVDQADRDGITPLYIVSMQGCVGVVELLIKAGADVDKASEKGATPLFIASSNGYVGVVKVLLRHDAKVNYPSNVRLTPLYIASAYGRVEVVEQLLVAGADVSKTLKDGFIPWYLRRQKDHADIVQLLNSADSFMQAYINGHTTVFEKRIVNNIDKSTQSFRKKIGFIAGFPLFIALIAGLLYKSV